MYMDGRVPECGSVGGKHTHTKFQTNPHTRKIRGVRVMREDVEKKRLSAKLPAVLSSTDIPVCDLICSWSFQSMFIL